MVNRIRVHYIGKIRDKPRYVVWKCGRQNFQSSSNWTSTKFWVKTVINRYVVFVLCRNNLSSLPHTFLVYRAHNQNEALRVSTSKILRKCAKRDIKWENFFRDLVILASVAKASFWENFQRDLGSWEDVVGEIVLTERQAKLYQERLGKFCNYFSFHLRWTDF